MLNALFVEFHSNNCYSPLLNIFLWSGRRVPRQSNGSYQVGKYHHCLSLWGGFHFRILSLLHQYSSLHYHHYYIFFIKNSFIFCCSNVHTIYHEMGRWKFILEEFELIKTFKTFFWRYIRLRKRLEIGMCKILCAIIILERTISDYWKNNHKIRFT